MPADITVEPHGDRWLVRDSLGDYWCDVQGNGWACDDIEDMHPITFRTAGLARAAFLQASRLYAERQARQEAAHAVLGISEV